MGKKPSSERVTLGDLFHETLKEETQPKPASPMAAPQKVVATAVPIALPTRVIPAEAYEQRALRAEEAHRNAAVLHRNELALKDADLNRLRKIVEEAKASGQELARALGQRETDVMRLRQGEDERVRRIEELEREVARLRVELAHANDRIASIAKDNFGSKLIEGFRGNITTRLVKVVGDFNRLCARGRLIVRQLRDVSARYRAASEEFTARVDEAIPVARSGNLIESEFDSYMRIVARAELLFRTIQELRETYERLLTDRLEYEEELQKIQPERSGVQRYVENFMTLANKSGFNIWELSGESRKSYDTLISIQNEVEAFGTIETLTGGPAEYTIRYFEQIRAFVGKQPPPRPHVPRTAANPSPVSSTPTEVETGQRSDPVVVLPGALFADCPRASEQVTRLCLLMIDSVNQRTVPLRRALIEQTLRDTRLVEAKVDLRQQVGTTLGMLVSNGYLERRSEEIRGMTQPVWEITRTGRDYLDRICRSLGAREQQTREQLKQAARMANVSRRS